MNLQRIELFDELDELHLIHGDNSLKAVYDAGRIENPNLMLIFMNPTSRNLSSKLDWKGI